MDNNKSVTENQVTEISFQRMVYERNLYHKKKKWWLLSDRGLFFFHSFLHSGNDEESTLSQEQYPI